MASRTQAILTTLGLTAVALALPSALRRRGSAQAPDDVYEALKTPSWAPPGWAFPVAWALNTAALAAGTQHLIARPAHPRRAELLGYLGVHAFLYATFARVYFDERSSVLAFAWTSADFAVGHLAFYRALLLPSPVAWAFVPVNLWLTIAVPLSAYQAAANRDPLFGTLGVETGEIAAAALGLPPIAAAVPAQGRR